MPKKVFNCSFCGKESFSYIDTKKFCSKRCFVLFQKKEHEEKYIYKCVDCGVEVDYRNKRCRPCFAKFFTGRKLTKDHVEKIVKNRTVRKGMESNLYVDGSSSLTKLIRYGAENKKWRNLVFARDNWTCQSCGIRGTYLEADHIKPFRQIFDEFTSTYNQFSVIEDKETLVRLSTTYNDFWDLNNGRTLCRPCHLKQPTTGRKRK